MLVVLFRVSDCLAHDILLSYKAVPDGLISVIASTGWETI